MVSPICPIKEASVTCMRQYNPHQKAELTIQSPTTYIHHCSFF